MDTFDDYIKRLSNDIFDMKVRIADKLAKDVIEGVKTPDWAKNMLAGIPEQLSRAEYEILEEILKEKNRFMEEKKTKKITKAKAFEYLKNAKIYVDCKRDMVLRKLFEIGLEWNAGGQEVDLGWKNIGEVYGLLSYDGKLHWFGQEEVKWFDNLVAPLELRANDVLSIEIVEDTKPDCERNEHVKALQELIAKSGCIDCIIISKNDIGILKK